MTDTRTHRNPGTTRTRYRLLFAIPMSRQPPLQPAAANPICVRWRPANTVGFRCPDCVRQQQSKFYTGNWPDYVIAVAVALPLSLIAGAIFTFVIAGIGFFSWFISFVAAPATGGIIAEAVRWAVGRRRSRHLNTIVAACLVLGVGSLPHLYAGYG